MFSVNCEIVLPRGDSGTRATRATQAEPELRNEGKLC